MRVIALLVSVGIAAQTQAQGSPPLLDPGAAAAIAAEVSGSAAKRTVQALSLHHRMRGSEGYNAAADVIRHRLAEYGLKNAETILLPADGKIFYGTQRARPAWNASFAELWERKQSDGRWVDGERVASWADQPITLAQDSVSGSADAELVDVGSGASETDYAGKDVRGKLVLISGQPEAAAGLAITKYGAAGIVSWAQNQKQAWWGDDESLIRWGHLDTWKDPAFAFMVSPARARAWQERLRKGETVRLRGRVEAGRTAGHYRIPTAVIPGRDRSKEIVFSCHLDHPSPGANDNASGCSGVLEVARSLSRLIANGQLPPPRRSLRFIWPCEIECTIALLNARPEFATRTLATIHLDMIGGDTDKTKGVLNVEGSPPSLPSFVTDVGLAIARYVDNQSSLFADRGSADLPLVEADGTKNALHAKIGGFSGGSDHQVWAEGSWRIPIVYLSDWPDRYIHTNRDVPDNLDSTKLRRAIFIAAATGWYLANVGAADLPELDHVMSIERSIRDTGWSGRHRGLSGEERSVAIPEHALAEAEHAASLVRIGVERPVAIGALSSNAPVPTIGATVYGRKPEPKGPMDGFGYSWFDDRLERAGLPRPALLDRATPQDAPGFAYEALNLVDGKRSVQQIRNRLLADVGSVPLEEVADYLATLEKLGLLERQR